MGTPQFLVGNQDRMAAKEGLQTPLPSLNGRESGHQGSAAQKKHHFFILFLAVTLASG
jgi:hypothetical protein